MIFYVIEVISSGGDINMLMFEALVPGKCHCALHGQEGTVFLQVGSNKMLRIHKKGKLI